MRMVMKFEIADINKTRADHKMKSVKKIEEVDLFDIYMQLNSDIINNGIAFEQVLSIKYDFSFNQILVSYLG